MQQASMGGYTDLPPTPTMDGANGFELAVMDHLRSGVFPELAQVQGSVYRGRDRRGRQLPRIETGTHDGEGSHDQLNPSLLQAPFETQGDGTDPQPSPSNQSSNKRLYYDHTPVEYVPKAPPMRELTLVNKRKSIEQERLAKSPPSSSGTIPAVGPPASRKPEPPSSTSHIAPSLSVESYETSSDASKVARPPTQPTQPPTSSALAPPPERHLNVPKVHTRGPNINLDEFIVEAITPLDPDPVATNPREEGSDAAAPRPDPENHTAEALSATAGRDTSHNSPGPRIGVGQADQLLYPSSQHGTYLAQTTGGRNEGVSSSTRPTTPRIGGSLPSPMDRTIPTILCDGKSHDSLDAQGPRHGSEMGNRVAQTLSAVQLWSGFLNFVYWLWSTLKPLGRDLKHTASSPTPQGKDQKGNDQIDDEREARFLAILFVLFAVPGFILMCMTSLPSYRLVPLYFLHNTINRLSTNKTAVAWIRENVGWQAEVLLSLFRDFLLLVIITNFTCILEKS